MIAEIHKLFLEIIGAPGSFTVTDHSAKITNQFNKFRRYSILLIVNTIISFSCSNNKKNDMLMVPK